MKKNQINFNNPNFKKSSAQKAVEYVKSGMILGLGTGSTTSYAIKHIAQLLEKGILSNIVGIPSSNQTESFARKLNIPISNLETHPSLDLTIDGADEVDSNLNLIKGGGGALLREKILVQASKKVIIVIDETKLSSKLGSKCPIPIEVIEFGWKPVALYLESLKVKFSIRKIVENQVFRTDEGNIIIDVNFGPIENPADLTIQLNQHAAIVENGIFVGLATEVIITGEEGVRILKK
jgi:ribose 5-phosphate isomerase A